MARRRSLLLAAAILAGCIPLGACHKPLFPEDTPRTQFEMHDRMRNRYRPTEQLDVFGRPQPALRARLAPAST